MKENLSFEERSKLGKEELNKQDPVTLEQAREQVLKLKKDMKLKLFLTYKDGMDGSYSVTLQNTKQEALDRLDRTEEQLEQGNAYDDGVMEEVELEIIDGKLVNPIHFYVE